MGTHQRRFALWALLAGTPRGFTLRELAQRFGVSKNTIHRDLDQLSTGGARVCEEQVGQTMMFHAKSGPPPASLTDDEKLALQLAEASFSPWSAYPLAVDLTSALVKLGAVDEIPFAVRGPVARARPDAAVLRAILAGLREHRPCVLDYCRRGAATTRALRAEPLRIFAATGLLYLRAVVRPRGAVVTLALHLVKACEVLDEHFRPVWGDSNAFGATDGEPQHVAVRFHPDIAPFIEERIWHASQRLNYEPDGSLRFEATLAGKHEFVGWVTSWGSRAELLCPSEWRAELRQRAIDTLTIHGGSE